MSRWQILIICFVAFVVWDFRRFRRAKEAGQPFAPVWYDNRPHRMGGYHDGFARATLFGRKVAPISR